MNDFEGITVGVHIRRGDYHEWCKGAYYYTDDVYIRIMHDLARDAVKRKLAIRFLLCSNEPLEIHQTDLSLIQIQDTDGVTDLYGLSRCDYIIGPPSTYSQWASFYGNVPLCLILSSEQKISFADFSPIIRLDTFADGRILQIDDQSDCFTIKGKR